MLFPVVLEVGREGDYELQEKLIVDHLKKSGKSLQEIQSIGYNTRHLNVLADKSEVSK